MASGAGAKASASNAVQQLKLIQQLKVASNVPYAAAKAAAKPIGYDFLANVHTLLVGPGQGRVYKRTNPTRVHIASAPGFPPATDLGRLTNSFKLAHIRTNDVRKQVLISVGSHLAYAAYLEFGTRHMLPRPYVRRAARITQANIPGILYAFAIEEQAKMKASGGTTS